jgi:YidC/Oxa1 family membrane protein insertase
MPLMFGFFAMQMPAGLSIYFIVSNLAGMGIQWVTNRLLKDEEPAPTGSRRSTVSSGRSADRSASSESKSKSSKSNYRKRGYKKRK